MFVGECDYVWDVVCLEVCGEFLVFVDVDFYEFLVVCVIGFEFF